MNRNASTYDSLIDTSTSVYLWGLNPSTYDCFVYFRGAHVQLDISTPRQVFLECAPVELRNIITSPSLINSIHTKAHRVLL